MNVITEIGQNNLTHRVPHFNSRSWHGSSGWLPIRLAIHTMDLSCTVSETNVDFENRKIFQPLCTYLTSPTMFPWNFVTAVALKKLGSCFFFTLKVERVWRYVHSFRYITTMWRTVGTDLL